MKRKITAKQTKIQLIVCIILIAVIAAGVGSYAWFYFNRSVYTFTHVEKPSTLAIKGPNQTTVEQIELSTVDLTDKNHVANFIFCVTGTNTEKYKLELAYTTNVPFTYTIKKTTQSTTVIDNALTHTDDGTIYYYNTDGDALKGEFINKATDTDGNTVADITENGKHDKHASAYDNYSKDKVQTHAEPVYYLVDPIKTATAMGEFVDYYILELSWDDKTATNYLKETDLVYLLAATSVSAAQ